MRIRYDPEVDALSLVFQETTVTTRELAEGIVAEFDAHVQLVGLEMLDAGSRLDEPSILREVTLEGVALTRPIGAREARGAVISVRWGRRRPGRSRGQGNDFRRQVQRGELNQ